MREIIWIKAALKDFQTFPSRVQERVKDALAIASYGQKSDIAKPMKGLGSGVYEIALPYRTDAYRVVYAVQIDDAIWVVHVFQKKSNKGISTPQREIDLIKSRLRKIKDKI